VWQGAAGEALTCNALEWQVAEGGGRIIEQDRTISVNNPAAIRAWQRAKHWIGWISPPSVVAFRELDSVLVFDAGKAAFHRLWFLTPMTGSGQSRHIGWRSFRAPVVNTGFSIMPGGPGGSAETLGGTGTAVSLRSAHLQEAVALVRFQLRALMKEHEKLSGSGAPTVGPHVFPIVSNQPPLIVARPSAAAGAKYKQVSQAYIDAVHSVLTGQKAASEAAAGLEKQLIEITGFSAGPPTATSNEVGRR
jgi:trehalose/maltose transport system substrate-binding protein